MLLGADIALPSSLAPDVSDELDDIVMRALERDPARRFATARDYGIAIANASHAMAAHDVGDWVARTAADQLRERAAKIGRLEQLTIDQGRPANGTLPTLVMPSNSIAPADRPTGARASPIVVLLAFLGLTSATIAALAMTRHSEHRPAPKTLAAPINALTPPLIQPDSPPAAAAPTEPRLEPKLTDSPRSQSRRRESNRTPAGRSGKPYNRNCDPPYTLDARGIRRVKPGCA